MFYLLSHVTLLGRVVCNLSASCQHFVPAVGGDWEWSRTFGLDCVREMRCQLCIVVAVLQYFVPAGRIVSACNTQFNSVKFSSGLFGSVLSSSVHFQFRGDD